jgi:hypothetical protein
VELCVRIGWHVKDGAARARLFAQPDERADAFFATRRVFNLESG